jgi:hypothetical protein
LICLILLDFGSRHLKPNQGILGFPDGGSWGSDGNKLLVVVPESLLYFDGGGAADVDEEEYGEVSENRSGLVDLQSWICDQKEIRRRRLKIPPSTCYKYSQPGTNMSPSSIQR